MGTHIYRIKGILFSIKFYKFFCGWFNVFIGY
jgi:hypothetical protein